MDIKILLQFAVFVFFFLGIYRYFIWKSRKCENKECKCPIKDNLREGYLIVAGMAFIVLVLIILVEIFVK